MQSQHRLTFWTSLFPENTEQSNTDIKAQITLQLMGSRQKGQTNLSEEEFLIIPMPDLSGDYNISIGFQESWFSEPLCPKRVYFKYNLYGRKIQ